MELEAYLSDDRLQIQLKLLRKQFIVSKLQEASFCAYCHKKIEDAQVEDEVLHLKECEEYRENAYPLVDLALIENALQRLFEDYPEQGRVERDEEKDELITPAKSRFKKG